MKLKHLSNPMIATDDHYKKLRNQYHGRKRLPLLKDTNRQPPFYPSMQYVDNVNVNTETIVQ